MLTAWWDVGRSIATGPQGRLDHNETFLWLVLVSFNPWRSLVTWSRAAGSVLHLLPWTSDCLLWVNSHIWSNLSQSSLIVFFLYLSVFQCFGFFKVKVSLNARHDCNLPICLLKVTMGLERDQLTCAMTGWSNVSHTLRFADGCTMTPDPCLPIRKHC